MTVSTSSSTDFLRVNWSYSFTIARVKPLLIKFTYIVSPGDLVGSGIGLDGALEVDVVALLDVGSVQAGPQGQGGARYIYRGKVGDKSSTIIGLGSCHADLA